MIEIPDNNINVDTVCCCSITDFIKLKYNIIMATHDNSPQSTGNCSHETESPATMLLWYL